MSERRFRILNVFTVAGERLSGNPLCVFEDGHGLDDREMQGIARQFNLSETTFILPIERDQAESAGANARVRIFTPTFEMPFAGHPTLGTAHVVRSLHERGDCVVLQMKAGLVEVNASGDRWTLRTAHAPRTRKTPVKNEDLAAMLGLGSGAIADTPLWVDTGAEQLVIPLASADDVRRARPNAELLGRHALNEKRGASMAYVWAPLSASGTTSGIAENSEVLARFFFLSDGGVVEDPATGSACANLGGWHLATNAALPIVLRVHQGETIARPSLLELRVDHQRQVFVSGQVEELGAGVIRL
jgi:trans-2,3-dihydro-3-hydroxyanthranilate isomerase